VRLHVVPETLQGEVVWEPQVESEVDCVSPASFVSVPASELALLDWELALLDCELALLDWELALLDWELALLDCELVAESDDTLPVSALDCELPVSVAAESEDATAVSFDALVSVAVVASELALFVSVALVSALVVSVVPVSLPVSVLVVSVAAESRDCELELWASVAPVSEAESALFEELLEPHAATIGTNAMRRIRIARIKVPP
jgi:hypothetical protein